ncbi:MAG: nucleoside phosphorylase [Saprospiraceae bacterium]
MIYLIFVILKYQLPNLRNTKITMIDIVILCPIELEYQVLRSTLSNLKKGKLNGSNLYYEKGNVAMETDDWNIAIFEIGKYIANVQSKTQQILSELSPQYAFLVGVAGGIRDVQIGDIVIGTKAYCYEYGKTEKSGFKSSPAVKDFSVSLVEIAKQINREQPVSGYKRVFGPINSGNKVLKDWNAEELEIIRSNYGDTVAVEMESYGFAEAASQFSNTRFINIRGISDLIKNKEEADKTGSQGMAMQRAVNFIFDLIEKLEKREVQEVKTEEVKINYFSKESILGSLIRPKLDSTTLFISEHKFWFNTYAKTIDSQEIKSIKHIKLVGDFAKNRIELNLINGDTFYISKKQAFAGFYNIFGGNKALFNRLKKCHI